MDSPSFRNQKDRKLVSGLLSRELAQSEQVHHAAHRVLILCEDQVQHKLVHRREDALKACGHPDWRTCAYCGEYDSPKNLYISGHSVRHRKCFADYIRARYNRDKLCIAVTA